MIYTDTSPRDSASSSRLREVRDNGAPLMIVLKELRDKTSEKNYLVALHKAVLKHRPKIRTKQKMTMRKMPVRRSHPHQQVRTRTAITRSNTVVTNYEADSV